MLLLAGSSVCIGNCRFDKDTLVLWENASLEYSACEGVLVCDWLCFRAENSEFPELQDIPLNKPMICSDTEFISQLIRSITVEFYSLSSRRTKLLDSLLRMLLIKISDCEKRRTAEQPAAEPYYNELSDLRSRIYRNPQQKWNVDSMAANVNMSRSYFQHIYKEVFGVSCISDVINSKIEKAKEILSETSCTVSQVAAMCGYDNEEHFMRQFKKIVGVTPTKFRKKA